MIKKIIEILNVGRFSSLRPEGGSESDFAQFNVIYAENGAGKSTLCDVQCYGGNYGVVGTPNARELLSYAERALSIIRR